MNKMKKINKKDLIETVAETGHLSKRDAKVAVSVTFDEILKSLLNGHEVNISNFGTFEVKERKSREIVHPKQQIKINVKSKKTITFKLSKKIKEHINK